jgi:peptide deformylase
MEDAAAFDLISWLANVGEVPPIVQAGADVLRRQARPVPTTLLATEPLRDLVRRMIEVMRRAPGVGLAAPQIGVPLRVFVAEDPEERGAALSSEARSARGRVGLPLMVLVNPELELLGAEEATFFEGCLSVRGYGALVSRRLSVRVRGVDAEGRAVSATLSGWPARIMQHEFDHLEGTLYVDRMLSRSLSCDAELPRLAALPVEDVLAELAVPVPGAARRGR